MISQQAPNEKLKKAILFDNLLMAQEAILCGANVNYGNGLPLMNAVGAKNDEMIKLLVRSGADVNARNKHAMMSAQRDNNQNLIKFFLDMNSITANS